MLTRAQQNALACVKQCAATRRDNDVRRINAVLSAAHLEIEPDDLIKGVKKSARLTTNFHPDRLIADGRSVIAALHEDGIYRSQFETKISNGGLTAYPGGDRDRWEARMLGGAYQAAGVTDAERPKYGGLNLMNYTDGACPRFGSCHLRLKHRIVSNATLTFGDSNSDPTDIGVIGAFEPVLAGLLERIAADRNALGRKEITLSDFVHALLDDGRGFLHPARGRALDDYIEAQLHGELSLAHEVEAIVGDPSFRGTATGELMEATAKKYGIPLEWHAGFALTLPEIPADFRGPEMLPLAQRILKKHACDSEYVDAATIGLAAVSVVVNPQEWADWGNPKDTLQHIKYLWHTLVVFGRPKQ